MHITTPTETQPPRLGKSARTSWAESNRSRQCPHYGGRLATYNLATGESIALSCGRWRCPVCGDRRRRRAAAKIRKGLGQWHASGHAIRSATLTFDEDVDLRELRRRQQRFVRLLRDRYGVLHYAAAVEFTRAGRPHLHFVYAVPSGRVPERAMRDLAIRARFGPNLRQRLVGRSLRDHHAVANYLTKALALTAQLGASRALTSSRNTVAKLVKPARSAGEWIKVRTDPDRPQALADLLRAAAEVHRRRQSRGTATASADV